GDDAIQIERAILAREMQQAGADQLGAGWLLAYAVPVQHSDDGTGPPYEVELVEVAVRPTLLRSLSDRPDRGRQQRPPPTQVVGGRLVDRVGNSSGPDRGEVVLDPFGGRRAARQIRRRQHGQVRADRGQRYVHLPEQLS